MSPRHNRRRADEPARSDDPGTERTEEWRGVTYVLRRIGGGASTKTYRCPGCDQEIRPATPHVVTWPADGGGVADRRHWHSACWSARERRGVKVHRSKNAPHYG